MPGKVIRFNSVYRDQIINRGGPSPKDILLANMWFHWNRVKWTEQKLLDIGAGDVLMDRDAILDERAHQLVARHLEARQDATEAAKEAAPYCHPKLAAVKVKMVDADPSALGDAELLEALQTLAPDELGIPLEEEPVPVDVKSG
jgi:hypothetical protein